MKLKIQSLKNYFKSKKDRGLKPIFFEKIGGPNTALLGPLDRNRTENCAKPKIKQEQVTNINSHVHVRGDDGKLETVEATPNSENIRMAKKQPVAKSTGALSKTSDNKTANDTSKAN